MSMSRKLVLRSVLLLAILLPTLQPLSHAPSPPAYSNALSMVAWGVFLVVAGYWATRESLGRNLGSSPARLFLWPIALIAGGSLVHLLVGRYGYLGTTVQGLFGLASAAVVLVAGFKLGDVDKPSLTAVDIAWVVLFCGLANSLLAWTQYFTWHDPDWWLNPLREMGRVYANLRQPNLLAHVLGLSVAATIWLRLENRLSNRLTLLFLVLLCPAVAFTGSRMGALMLVLLIPLALWGSQVRLKAVLWCAVPLAIYLVAWWGLQLLQAHTGIEFYGANRLGGADATGLRWPLWRNSLEISTLHPWLGCGFQQFNFCFTHADLPERAPANFNNAHNLFLNLVVEFGWPLGLLTSGLLLYGFWQLRPRNGDSSSVLYFSLMTIAAVHAMLEFPWWNLYFLFPFVFVVGMASSRRLGIAEVRREAGLKTSLGWWVFAGVTFVASGVYYAWSYASLLPVYSNAGERVTGAEALKRSTRAVLFQDYVEYSLVMAISDGTEKENMGQILSYFHFASRGHMDAKFLLRYAQVAAIAGQAELSRHLMWRALQINPDAVAETEVAAELTDDPALQSVVEFAKNPYPVNLPLKLIEALR
jgi:O-antigen ligase